MSRFPLDYSARAHVAPAEHPHFYPSGQHDRDERGSISDSEDGNYAPYTDPLKVETDTEDESTTLTSQTLNTDGTPKRPMNAFMIFARRRRPQVSAENQAMRTGEISKILSKEWNAMQPTEKQFYQDQAKQLKDSFNNKYPDYVYRRRPNNSRKRRKPEGSGGRIATDNPLPLDMGDDLSTFGDVGGSPTDGEDHSLPDIPLDVRRGRLPHDVQQNYNDQGKFGSSSRASPYAYTIPDHSFRPNGTHDPRSYGPNSERVPSSSLAPQTDLHYQYNVPMQIRSHSHSLSSPAYDSNGQESWDTTVGPGAYLASGHPRHQTSQPNLKSHSYSSPATHSSWQPSSTAPSTSSASPNFLLPTLNSPFHPSPSPLQDSLANSTSSSTPNPMSPSSYNSNHLHPIMPMKQEYDSHGYHRSLSTSPTGVFPSSSGRDTPLFPQRQPSLDLTRGLPISHYQQHLSPQPQSSAPGIQQGYWRS